jgi:predicted Mrr-cat superfamily restriction endonuclease
MRKTNGLEWRLIMSNQDKVYLVRAGRNGEDEEYVLENNRAIIGWQDVPSLEGAKDYDDEK